jgi:DNA-binding Lrp family transcriptional regulator
MDMDPLILILAVLFILAVSFFAIGIYFSTRSKKKDAPRREKPALVSLEEVLQEEGILEIARLLRDERSGTLLLEKSGVIYRTAADLNPEQRRLLSIAAGDLHAFLGLMSAPQSEDANRASTPTVKADDSSGAPSPSRPKGAGQIFPEAEVKSPSMSPVDIFTRAIASDVPKVVIKSKSITAQIDDILQERLVNTPLEQRGIRLLDAPDGRVVVFIGIESYDGVDAVPDEEVRRAIRAAVAEWEKRSSHNM